LPTRVIEINTLFGRPLAELLGKSAHGALFVLPSLPDRTKLDKLAQLDSVRFFIDSLAYLVDKLALDYVLLDSRTGFARVAPLALRSADLFVLVTRLDAQNASGIRDLLQITRRKPTILLASMVPDPDLDVPASMREARLREFEATTGGKIDVVVPFDKRLLFGDLIPAVHFDADSPVCTAIRELAELILEMRS
jgi:MinD-like ATPase involved in chromosome partitioning or flagellar assembly